MLTFDPFNMDDLLKSHKILMAELTNEAGRFRFGGVGVFAGEKLVHMAPPAEVIPKLISDLIHWVKCQAETGRAVWQQPEFRELS